MNLSEIQDPKFKLESYRRAVEPFVKMRCDLEAIMPLVFKHNPDGTLTKMDKHGWPDWAITQAELLDNAIETVGRITLDSLPSI